MKITVIICTYNPRLDYLGKVLQALAHQSLATTDWELLIIDNNSSNQFAADINIAWHPNAKIIREEKSGLANARIAGVNNALAGLIVFVDDDNVLNDNYLEICLSFHYKNPQVGCFGGKSLPVFEVDPPEWFYQTGISLGCRDDGDEQYVSNYKAIGYQLEHYPEKAPIGTGMVITKEAFLSYQNEVVNNAQRLRLGRNGSELTSGEDNDIIITIVKNHFEIAYLPQLIVTHLIPANRTSYAYLKKMAYQSNRSWVTLLLQHKMCPFALIPKWSVWPRKIKTWFLYKAWQSPLNAIRWYSACGMYDSLSNNG